MFLLGTMRQRRVDQLSWAVILTMGAGAAIALALGAMLPMAVSGRPDFDGNAARGGTAMGAADGVPSIEALSSAWAVDLRRPLTDPPPVAPPPPAPADDAAPSDPEPAIHLYGTVIEPGHSMAMLVDATGKTQFLGMGAEIQGARIISIRDNAVGLRWNGRDVSLVVEKPEIIAPKAAPTPPPVSLDPGIP